MKLYAEAAAFDDEKIGDDIGEAGKVATNYIADISSGGVFVHQTDPGRSGDDPDDADAYGVHISDDVDIVRGGEVVASYGDAAVIGNADKSRAYLDYHSFQMLYGDETAPYVHFSDLRGRDGLATMTEAFEGGVSLFMLNDNHVASVTDVTVDDESVSFSTDVISGNTIVSIEFTPSQDAVVLITYTTSGVTRAYTIGTRDEGIIGNHSVSVGVGNVAEGKMSYAEGYKVKANGSNCHAEGYETEISRFSIGAHAEGIQTYAGGEASHAEGSQSRAEGMYSHAQNLGTLANSPNQTAMGKFNVEDTSNAYAIIVGNGSSSNRSNALTLNWNGDLEAAGIVSSKTGASRISCDMATGLSGSTYLIYDTVTQTVRVYGVFAASSSQQASVALATIPSGYRPTSDTYIAGTVTNGSNVTASTAYTVGSDGKIKQNNTNAAMSGMFVGEYAI